MNNTMQLYIDEKKEIKGYPITSHDRVIDENGVSIKEQLDTIANEKAEKEDVKNVQQQINNLVLEASGDSNAEVIQARGNHMVLNDRIYTIENNISDYLYDQKYNFNWVVGLLNGSDGTIDTTRKFRISMADKVVANDDLIVTGDISLKKYTWWVMFFNEDGTPKITEQITHHGSISSIDIKKGDIFKISMGTVEYDGSIVYENIYFEEVFAKFSVIKKNGVSFESLKKIISIENNLLSLDEDLISIDKKILSIENLNDKLKLYIDTKYFINWVVAYCSGTGVLNPDIKYRISTATKNIATSDIKCTFNNTSKYRYWILLFDEDGNTTFQFESSPNYPNTSYTIPCGSIYMLSMARAVDNIEEIFGSPYNDVFEGFNMSISDITFDNIKTNKEEIENIKNEIGMIINEKDGNVLGIAHRGLSLECPENTMIAYKEAYNKGFRILETDIKITSDDVLVLLHDQTINRTARNKDGSEINQTINISNISYQQANEYDYGIYKGEEFKGTKLATLEELLLYAKKRNCKVYIDGFASNLINKIYLLVNKIGMVRNVIWSSFIKSDLQQILNLDKKAHVVYLYSGASITNAVIDDVATLKTDFNKVSFATYYPNVTDLGIIEYAHYVGVRFGVYSVNINTEIIKFVNAGVEEITTDGINVAQVMLD